ncbi:DUF4974 domain-containing protein [Algoriphagus sp. D3-2-R+10]|uniref:FecR family protein n=1 Tax=Algoriphagus aurantiacus TaxID=3103948 RepID=UPI002B3E7719|nr:FecR domain-containing protein [Algoriphagus sp. D3-2-R+10]MEB2774677.1 DUF4974 domain-containing protein [Algoriphagus sp. D3-2-R+10]
MHKYSEGIDFSIIWKKLHTSLTGEEEEQLKLWLSESTDHQNYFEQVKLFYRNGSQFEDGFQRSEDGWSAISNKVDFKKSRKKNRRLIYATSVAASILVLLAAFYVFKPFLSTSENTNQTLSAIVPGTDKAILMTDDGASYDLSTGTPLTLEEGGTEITSQGTSIKYNEQKGDVEVKYNTLIIPRGGKFNLTLADGTRVWLNADSRLKYPTSFPGEYRVVELTGEAYFEVSKNAQKPFKVLSGSQVIQVLGTSFNISSYQDDPIIATTLVEGKVEVYLEHTPSEHQMLLPNQQSILVKDYNSLIQKNVNVQEFISWKDGWFYFRDKSLEAIMLDLSRWYDVSVQFEDPEMKKLPFTGEFRRYENLEEVLNLLEKTGEVKFETERRKIIIK